MTERLSEIMQPLGSPTSFPRGMEYVLVNGVPAIAEGKMTGATGDLLDIFLGSSEVILAFWSGPAVAVKFGPPGRVLATLRGWGNGSVAG